jgi:hypothetical protein
MNDKKAGCGKNLKGKPKTASRINEKVFKRKSFTAPAELSAESGVNRAVLLQRNKSGCTLA